MMQSGASVCNTCGDQVGFNANGEVFVACHECNFPICKSCFHDEIKEDGKACLRCTSHDENLLDDVGTKESGNPSTMAAHLSNSKNTGVHARQVSSVSTVDSKYKDESGNPIWKNRVESRKGKKNKKKKTVAKAEKEAEAPPAQQMEENQQSLEAAQPLSTVIPVPKSKL